MSSLADTTNIAETLNTAIEMQIDAKLQTAGFDTTVEGTILSIEDKDKGIYLVQIQSARFTAYSVSGTSYRVNDAVYINVPRNDYSQQKFIIGRKSNYDGGVFQFKYPFDNFVILADLHNNSNQTIYNAVKNESKGFYANNAADGCDPVPEQLNFAEGEDPDPNLIWHWLRKGDAWLGTKLGIAADWIARLGEYNPQSGRYGLRILVNGEYVDKDGQASNITKEYLFTTNDMYGNPYSFMTPYPQQILLDVSGFSAAKIEEIAVYFWQDHNFVDDHGNKIVPDLTMDPTLIISNFQAYSGYEADELDGQTLFLLTYSPLTFGGNLLTTTAEERAKIDTKDLHANWIHDTGDKNFIVIKDVNTLNNFNKDIPDEAQKGHLYWYRQTGDAEAIKALAAEYKDNAIISKVLSYAGHDYILMPEYTDQFVINYQMDTAWYKQRFKVVMVWNNTYEVSDPLTFTNVDSNIENENEAYKTEIIFKIFKPEKYKDIQGNIREHLVEDISGGTFLIYDENNYALYDEYGTSYAEMNYYVQLQIYNRDTDSYTPLILGDGDSVTWDWPASGTTMIRYMSNDVITDDAEIADIMPTGANISYNTVRRFQIGNIWQSAHNNNIITAVVKYNGVTRTVQKDLIFGMSGNQGTPYTIRMVLAAPNHYAITKDQYFRIESYIYDQTGKKIESPLFEFKYSLLDEGPCHLSATAVRSEKDVSSSTWNIVSTQGYNGNALEAYLNTALPPVLKVIVNLHDPDYPYDIEYSRGFMATNNQLFINEYSVSCPDRIEYKSDGSLPIYDTGFFEVRNIADDKLIYPAWEIKQYHMKRDYGADNSYHEYLSEITPTEYDYLRLEGRISYDEPLNSNVDDEIIRQNQIEETNVAYMRYKLNAYLDNFNNIAERGMAWYPGLENMQAVFIGFRYSDISTLGDVSIWQALSFARSVHSSSLLNSWDGQLKVDSEKNAVLSKMISAGTTNNRNEFTGVIMGDWADYGDASIDPVGIYGFDKGVQTFGFKTDGTGFIGAAGRGQIVFDGNQALISDYSRDHYINLNPMHPYQTNPDDLAQSEYLPDNGSYSQYFLYSKNVKLNTDTQKKWTLESVGNYSKVDDLSRYGYINTNWAKVFEDDMDYDYFVVDPNNGVYMSGGIIARYGKIGGCLELSSAGLTYKKNNDIIFIGQERRRNGLLINDDDDNRQYDKNYWDARTDGQGNYFTPPPQSFYTDEVPGRYIIWAGTGEVQQLGSNSYLRPTWQPNFGVEHDGTVHLNEAFVQGAIYASSLNIVMPDQQYHDAQERLANTYYSDFNPGDVTHFIRNGTVQVGMCEHFYGDKLLKSDLWYDTSTVVSQTQLSQYAVNYKNGGLNTDPMWQDPYVEGTDIQQVSSGLEISTTAVDPVDKTGYKVYRWMHDNSNTFGAFSNYEAVVDNNGVLVLDSKGYSQFEKRDASGTTLRLNLSDREDPETKIIYPPDGWEIEPALSADILNFMNDYSTSLNQTLASLSENLGSAISDSYNNIRRGITPISFMEDGNCYVSVSARPINFTQQTIQQHGIGSIPAGIAIYQLNDENRYDGSCFLLNGNRMGFYKSYTIDLMQDGQVVYDEDNQPIQQEINIPLLTYYNGNMALAGSLMLGLDIDTTTGDYKLRTNSQNQTVYKNEFNGPAAYISLNNDAIRIDSGLTNIINNEPYPYIKVGGLEGPNDTYSAADIRLAGFRIKGITGQQLTATINPVVQPLTLLTSFLLSDYNPSKAMGEDSNYYIRTVESYQNYLNGTKQDSIGQSVAQVIKNAYEAILNDDHPETYSGNISNGIVNTSDTTQVPCSKDQLLYLAWNNNEFTYSSIDGVVSRALSGSGYNGGNSSGVTTTTIDADRELTLYNNKTRCTYNQYTRKPWTSTVLNNLNAFIIQRPLSAEEERTTPYKDVVGIQFLENPYYVILSPYKPSAGLAAHSALVEWDLIAGATGQFTNLFVNVLHVKKLYIEDVEDEAGNITAYEAASQKWYNEVTTPIVTDINIETAKAYKRAQSAQSSAWSAYGHADGAYDHADYGDTNVRYWVSANFERKGGGDNG